MVHPCGSPATGFGMRPLSKIDEADMLIQRGKREFTMKKKQRIGVILIAIMIMGLLACCSNPMVIGDMEIPEAYMEAVKGQAKGFYSKRLPLVPVYVGLERYSEDVLFYTVHYFPFGTVEMSYIEGDGYNIEEPLWNM